MSTVQPLIGGPQPPADLLLRDVHVLDPRAGIDARHDVRVHGGLIVEIGEPGTLGAEPGALDANLQATDAEHGASGGGGTELIDGAGRLRFLLLSAGVAQTPSVHRKLAIQVISCIYSLA